MGILNLVLTVLWLILFVWALLDIIKARKSNGWKLIWLLVCLVFPVLGVILYYFLARQKDMQLPEDFKQGIK